MKSPESKKDLSYLREQILSGDRKDYWRSVEEFADTPEFEEFVKRQYPAHGQEWNDPVTRRSFLKVMGATLALAGLSGCVIQPPEKIVPRVRDQEDVLPGKPLFFATAMLMNGIATGVLAKSFEGRPIKLEGNPEHPGSLGATDVFTQASLLDMYDPDRSQEISFRGSPKTWLNFTTAIRTALAEQSKNGGAGVRILTETVTSPTFQDQIRRLQAELPNMKWVQYEPVNSDNVIEGARLAFGSPAVPVYNFDKAERVLSLDADIFSGSNPRYMADLIKARGHSDGSKTMGRIYVVETGLSLIGSKADHRLAVKPSQLVEIAKAAAAAVGVSGAASASTDNAAWVAAMAKDLSEHRGRSLVVAGNNQPAAVHALAYAMNSALGNVGQTVSFIDPLSPSEKPQREQLRELVADIDAGRVSMLMILGGNPVYKSPADLKLNKERLEKVGLRIHLGLHFDETAELCHWHVAEKHYLESWGDARAFDGTVTMIQPLIEPLYGGKSALEIVQLLFREEFEKKDLDIVKGYWQSQNLAITAPAAAPASSPAPAASPTPAPAASPTPMAPATAAAPQASPTPAARETITIAEAPRPVSPVAPVGGGTFEDNWRRVVHDGFVPNSASPARTYSASTAFLSAPAAASAAAGPLEIAILPDPSIYDGRFSNNGWLQELPNPLNKVTWDNVALVSPATATRLQLNRGNDPDEISGGERGTAFINTYGSNMSADTVNLTYQGSKIEKPVPVWISPGQPDDVVTIFMGYGRTRAGKIGTGIGYNAFDVMRSDAMNFGFGTVEKTGEKAEIATTQIHFNMEGRDLLRIFDVDVFEATPEAWHQEDFYDKSLYKTAYDEVYSKQYATHNKWGMTIDLNSCVGCNACVIACQAENNIPVVGREQVERSREMHWLRIDSYFTGGDVNKPEGLHFQPVLCQQCEQAPCEVVCPVTATVHNPEGLNDMVYNRCVGTRYCSNNCPYKVRRFNFLLYQDWDTPQYKLMRNPEVSIRSRGVMEKCTYCTQRISAARIEAQKDDRPIADGEILTACQAACPTGAIIFGDLNDPLSKVAKAKEDHRNYNLLNELNTQPRTTYLAGLKNQNKEMPDYRPLKLPKTHAPAKKEGEKTSGGDGH
ncbi:MAG: TAT-variant-translocated molybdopterin oxidoreductase [Chloracidobacterium sp.]|nr:TAT-variant-translocated molybdopterin oxidoreductase [Chloracidobacterium sp.]